MKSKLHYRETLQMNIRSGGGGDGSGGGSGGGGEVGGGGKPKKY